VEDAHEAFETDFQQYGLDMVDYHRQIAYRDDLMKKGIVIKGYLVDGPMMGSFVMVMTPAQSGKDKSIVIPQPELMQEELTKKEEHYQDIRLQKRYEATLECISKSEFTCLNNTSHPCELNFLFLYLAQHIPIDRLQGLYPDKDLSAKGLFLTISKSGEGQLNQLIREFILSKSKFNPLTNPSLALSLIEIGDELFHEELYADFQQIDDLHLKKMVALHAKKDAVTEDKPKEPKEQKVKEPKKEDPKEEESITIPPEPVVSYDAPPVVTLNPTQQAIYDQSKLDFESEVVHLQGEDMEEAYEAFAYKAGNFASRYVNPRTEKVLYDLIYHVYFDFFMNYDHDLKKIKHTTPVIPVTEGIGNYISGIDPVSEPSATVFPAPPKRGSKREWKPSDEDLPTDRLSEPLNFTSVIVPQSIKDINIY